MSPSAHLFCYVNSIGEWVLYDKNYRIVLSNMMSAKDYAKACEEGFDCYSLGSDDTVTILDRIKAEVAKSGDVIVGYNDSLDSAKLAEALGSESLANSFERADIPCYAPAVNC